MAWDDTVATVKSAAGGAIVGAFAGYLERDRPYVLPSNPAPFMPYHHRQDFVGPLAFARNYAILYGVNAGINCIMKRERGKEDLQSRMFAGFGAGALFSLVCGFGAPCEVGNMVTLGLYHAMVEGALFKLEEKLYEPPSYHI